MNVTVTTNNNLNVDKVKITSGHYSINRTNDKELFSNKFSKIIIDGNSKSFIQPEFGENDFLIIYDRKYYLSFRHFITTDFVQDYPTGYKYKFRFWLINNKPILSVDIHGEQPMKFEREMIEVHLAEKYKCNAPLDSAATIYNMIELENRDRK